MKKQKECLIGDLINMAIKKNNTIISIKHKNTRTKKTYSLSKYVSGLTYVDNATGEGDTLDVTFTGSYSFLNKFYPGKKDLLYCTIEKYSDSSKKKKLVNNQSFHVDSVSFDGLTTCTIKGISTPPNNCFAKTPRTKTYKKTTLKNIAGIIAKRTGIKLYYNAPKINIKNIKQNKETDCSFLSSLCTEYGIAMKIYSNKLVIFAEDKFEKKKSITTIKPNHLIEGSLSCDIDLIHQYTGFRFKYKPDKNHTSTNWCKWVNVKPLIFVDIGECDSESDGYLKGSAKVNEANKNMQIVRFEIPGSAKYAAATCIRLNGFYRAINGKYYINQVTHNYDAERGYTCSIEARLIQPRIKRSK